MTDATTPTELPTQQEPPTQPWLGWILRHRRISIAGAVVIVLALVAVVDWPHRATAGQLRSDFAQYATQVRGDVQSCSVEVEETLSAYNQITAGVVRDRQTAEAIASQTALDCTPMGNSRIDDLGTLQPPSSLANSTSAHRLSSCIRGASLPLSMLLRTSSTCCRRRVTRRPWPT